MPVRPAVQKSLLVLTLALAALLTAVQPASAHNGGGRWECIAHYESTHRWAINTGNGYYGGLQFSLATWRHYGGPQYSGNAFPHQATRAEQIVIARRTASEGWLGRRPQGGASAWPNTWHKCG